MIFREARTNFLVHCNSALTLSPHTYRAYEGDLIEAEQFLGYRKQIHRVSKENLRSYIYFLRGVRALKEATIKRKIASLKLLFRWIGEEGHLQENPFSTLNERIRLPKRLPRGLDRADSVRLKNALSTVSTRDDFDSLVSKTAIHLLLETGIRVGELVTIKLDDLSLTSGHIYIHGKGNRQRLVYLLQKPLSRGLEKYIVLRNRLDCSSTHLFVNSLTKPMTAPHIRKALKIVGQAAAIDNRVTPHMLRHTCATQWLEDGLDIRYVQKLLGHHSISTTEIYTHVSDQGLREALLRANGRRNDN